jgi:maleylacetoacetate isomerase/maleylpyruvate isomerase
VARILYGYWRSSAAYRVRIALNWKALAYESVAVNLRTGEQLLPQYRAVNPQGFVPLLVDGATQVSQSLAIIEYLEECYPRESLLPRGAAQRARVRAMAQVIACDIHPINNLRVLKFLAAPVGQSQPQVEAWAQHWIRKGFETLEALADAEGPYLAGPRATVADVCLVPQLYNARRVKTDLAPYPRLLAVEERLQDLPAFSGARPEAQADAVSTG